ncbi:hydroxypyruvate isomerase [Buttiauxella brennerae]|uniref:hydroxypyruvate isomerase n=1 Tax=Buttiauxella brennerae TaxID=82988 RepID=UPI00286EEAB0|nr:hydroxypyruvate isomerase [Buttiauxella brennerae]
MLRFSANLSMLFLEYDFLERFDRAAAAGFKAVEFMFPYGYSVATLQEKLHANGLEHTLHNLPAGDWEKGERGIACIPGREEEFRSGVQAAILYANALGNKKINCLVGKTPAGVSPETVRQTLVDNLRYAGNELAKEGLLLVIEPINHFDIPGFYLTGTQQAIDLIAEIGCENIRVQYDIYHMQRMEGELTNTLINNLPKIGHIQLADNPGRGEPGTGEINYDYLFSVINQSDYDGWVGCEYKPKTTTEEGISWINRYR